MKPRKDDEVLVDVIDVLLRDGAILRADVIVSVADIPLVGIKLTAALAGMETMREYGLFEEWDVRRRRSAISRRQYDEGDRRRAARRRRASQSAVGENDGRAGEAIGVGRGGRRPRDLVDRSESRTRTGERAEEATDETGEDVDEDGVEHPTEGARDG